MKQLLTISFFTVCCLSACKNDKKLFEPNFTPILTSYSTQGYKNCGFNDSIITNSLSMQGFMNSWDKNTQSKLFKKIKSLHVQITKQKFA